MKKGTPHHPKMRCLATTLKVPIPYAVGVMEMLWHYVAQVSPRGDIGVVSDLEIAGAVAWDKKPAKLIDVLVNCGWLDRNSEHRLVVHDWPEHCDNYIAKILRRKKLDFLPLYGVSVNDSDFLSRQKSDKSRTNFGHSRVAEAEAEAIHDSSPEENSSTRARAESPAPEPTAPEESVDETPAEWPPVRRLWEKRFQKLKASERKLFEQRVGEVDMPEDEWAERMDAYKASQWAENNGYPLRGFLKAPDSWELPRPPVEAIVAQESPVRAAILLRPCAQRYFFAFPKNRRELLDRDLEAAWPILEQLTDEQVNAAAAHAERNFPTWNNIPSPVNHLATKPWDSLYVVNPNPVRTRPLTRSEEASLDARRRLGIA